MSPAAEDDGLARVAGERSVVLVTRGRKSGHSRKVTVWFVVVDGFVGLGTLNEDRNWVRNARQTSAVELVFADGRMRGVLRDAFPDEHARIRARMARKYWPFRVAGWLGMGQRFTFRVDPIEWR